MPLNAGREAIMDPDERLAREVWSVSQRLTNVVTLLIQALPPIVVFTYQLYKWSACTSLSFFAPTGISSLTVRFQAGG